MFQNVLTTPEALPARRPDRPGGTKPQTPLPASPPRQGSRLPQSVWRQRRLRHVHRAGAESFSQGRPSIGYPTTTAPDLIGVKPTGPVVKCPAKAAFGWLGLRTNATAGGAVVTGVWSMTRPPSSGKSAQGKCRCRWRAGSGSSPPGPARAQGRSASTDRPFGRAPCRGRPARGSQPKAQHRASGRPALAAGHSRSGPQSGLATPRSGLWQFGQGGRRWP